MTMKHAESQALIEFTRRQSNLNHFLWTTELVYGIVKQRKILEKYPKNDQAWKALSRVRAEAWFPSAKGRGQGDVKGSIKYKGTIGEMRQQLDENFVIVLWSVAAMFVAEFERYIEARFPRWVARQTRDAWTVPAPAALLKSLCEVYKTNTSENIDPGTTLKADLMKKIRNLYVHKGLGGIPRKVDDPEIKSWIKFITKGSSPYSADQANSVVRYVIGGAVDRSRAATKDGKQLGEEFFYALFTLTNIRNFALALDANFPADLRKESPN